MRIISTTDLSREGNDCYIYESISFVEQFGLYIVIGIQKVTGWADRENVCVLHTTMDTEEAMECYKHYGGVLDEAVSID
jgi:hypothetical protein